jgi:putative membrane protein
VPVANDNSPPDPKNFKKDAKFVREAIADNTLEIRLAQVAETKTTDPRVRQLARRLLDDHTAMQGQWIALAKRNGINMKPGIGPRHMEKVKRMERTSGGDFDKAYPTMLIQNNQDYVEYFQKEGKATHSAQVRNQAESDLHTLRQHLIEAKQAALVHGVDTTAALKARNLSSYKKQ